MKILKLKFYSDPGHGWLAVKRAVLNKLSIQNDISAYSYQKGDTVYLEEDCDMTRFMRAYEFKYGKDSISISNGKLNRNCRSPIRSYEDYKAQ